VSTEEKHSELHIVKVLLKELEEEESDSRAEC